MTVVAIIAYVVVVVATARRRPSLSQGALEMEAQGNRKKRSAWSGDFGRPLFVRSPPRPGARASQVRSISPRTRSTTGRFSAAALSQAWRLAHGRPQQQHGRTVCHGACSLALAQGFGLVAEPWVAARARALPDSGRARELDARLSTLRNRRKKRKAPIFSQIWSQKLTAP